MSACQGSQGTAALPTLMQIPTETVMPTVTLTETATATYTATATHTATITQTPTPSPTASATQTRLPTTTNTPRPTATVTRGPTATPLPSAFIFGQSVAGADLLAYRVGTGERVIMLIGGIHAGFERNTVTLVEELRDHFRERPNDVAAGITLLFVPSLNVDGLAYGRQLRGRFNANEVDLNRNWGCGWSPEAVFGRGPVDPGSEPFSEPETIALGSLIQRVQPRAVLFYHAAANGVFAGDCESNSSISEELAALYGEATGYPFGSDFSAYAVTGTGPAWVDSVGIPSVDVELASAETTEFQRNLAGVLAVQQWLSRSQ